MKKHNERRFGTTELFVHAQYRQSSLGNPSGKWGGRGYSGGKVKGVIKRFFSV